MSTIHLDIVSATELIYSGAVDCVFAPGKTGELGIYPKHTALMSVLRPGEIRFEINGDQDSIYVSGGIIEVQPDIVTVFSDTAIRAHDLDEEKVMQAKQRAEEAMMDSDSSKDIASLQLALAESIAQLRMISKVRKGK
jgi:F-type H+-transporting ATPase subunit epsilon